MEMVALKVLYWKEGREQFLRTLLPNNLIQPSFMLDGTLRLMRKLETYKLKLVMNRWLCPKMSSVDFISQFTSIKYFCDDNNMRLSLIMYEVNLNL